jgi:sugar phosphate isomerase/epimerase
MADEFQCRYVQTIGPAHSSLRVAAASFGSLCDRAGGHGLVVGLEFLPFTDIAAVDQARDIVEAAGRANGGICVDIWHHERGANDLAAIAALPAELITGVQLSDGPRSPSEADYFTDCLENRVALGDGEFDVEAFVTAVRGTGSEVPFAAEVCSKDGWQHAEEHVSRLAKAMRRYQSLGPSRVRAC